MPKDTEELITKLRSAIFNSSSSSDPYDPRNVSDDVYTTHTPFNEQSKEEEEPEQEEMPPEEGEEEVPEQEPGEEQQEPQEEVPEEGGEQPGQEGMPPEEGGEMDPNDPNAMAGMGEEPPKDPQELGKIYELKKIYSRLVSIESYLSNSSDLVLLKLRNHVSQAIELFETLAANIKSYENKLNDIIITFYEFIEMVYKILRIYYDKKRKEDKRG